MSITNVLRRLTEKLGQQIKSTIKPQSLVYYKDRRPRDANYYHYRYPSPGSTPVGQDTDKEANYRLGYRDSVHNIRDFEHYINEPDAKEERIDFNPNMKNKAYIDSRLISVK